MFACPRCRASISLPRCDRCGHAVETVDGIHQLTADPETDLQGQGGASYIGYGRIGEHYHGRGWAESPCDGAEMAVGGKLAELVSRGTLLDVGCGGGIHAVPAALHGCTVIAGDISNGMLRLLLRKAAANGVDPSRLIPCRLNALSLPLGDASVDGATVNNVLHLVSHPERVIAEVRRVLRPGGRLVVQVHPPAPPAPAGAGGEFVRREEEFDRRYWSILGERGLRPAPRNWRFDQLAGLESAFGPGARVEIDFADRRTVSFAGYFLYRMGGKGFSAQQGVPEDAHVATFAQVVGEFRERYGPDFGEFRHEVVTRGLALRVFTR